MLKQINKKADTEERWPCVFCDQWKWDLIS